MKGNIRKTTLWHGAAGMWAFMVFIPLLSKILCTKPPKKDSNMQIK